MLQQEKTQQLFAHTFCWEDDHRTDKIKDYSYQQLHMNKTHGDKAETLIKRFEISFHKKSDPGIQYNSHKK